MTFELIKLTGGLLMPLPVVLVLLVVGLTMLVASRRRRLGIGFIAAGTVLLLVVFFPWFSERALRDLEQEYLVLREPPQAALIVVLGGGSRDNQSLPPASRLGESSLYRLAEGVRLAKLLTDARLVSSGGDSERGDLSTAEIMEQVAVGWGIDVSRIITLTDPRNTEAEARAAAEIVDEQGGVILVTSAFHMRRAKALFEGQGLEVIPAPAGHLVDDPQRGERHIGYQLPQAKYIGYAERALWEHIGLLWARLKGAD